MITISKIILVIYFILNIILAIYICKKSKLPFNFGYIVGTITILLFGTFIFVGFFIHDIIKSQMNRDKKITNYNELIDKVQDMDITSDSSEEWKMGYIYARNQAVNIIKDAKKENENGI